jgi:hypothetical protein
MTDLVEIIASRLDTAWRTGVPIPPITETYEIKEPATAYAI